MQAKRKSWDRVIDDLTRNYDLSRAEARTKAYEDIVVYAEQHLAKDPMCNMFLAHAADRLGTVRVMRDVVREIVPCPESACIHMAFDQNEGPVLTGNREGLRYLSELLEVLAGSPMDGEHAHLYWDEPPLYGETYGLTVYLEDDEWFEEQAVDYYSAQEEEPAHPKRDLNPEKVMALQFATHFYSSLSVTTGKVYLVREIVKRCGDEVWTKLIRDDDSRIWIFTIMDDRGEEVRLGLDIDDSEVNFLTREELDQFLV